MRFRLANADAYPAGLNLPWATPLDEWPDDLCTEVEPGLHRNPVRFVAFEDSIYTVKELLEHVATREYAMLHSLEELKLPVVEPVGLVTDRPTPPGHEPQGLLVTRFLKHAMPFRHVIARGVTVTQAYQLLDALAELLVNLHLSGFFWGDCSLSNALFRLDAGRYSAYLVDAETAEIHASLSNGQRQHDLMIAQENVAGEFMDIQAGFGLPAGLDPAEMAAGLVSRYESLWAELTREEVFSAQEQYRIDTRIKRLNQLGFDVEELDIQTLESGHKIRLRVKVVEPGHHRRRLEALTGLDVQENQARRMLNDLDHFRAWKDRVCGEKMNEKEAARRWLDEAYTATLDRIPPNERAKLDDAEIFHQLLEHRWYLSERTGHDMPLESVVPSYTEEILAKLPVPTPIPPAGEAGREPAQDPDVP